jgi:hypothetical protein
MNKDQCVSPPDSLSGVCGLYNGRCEILCTKIMNEEICNKNGEDDCFWINGEDFNDINCIDRV